MPLKLNSSGGGAVTLDVPSTASLFTLTAPAVNGNLVTTGDSGTVTNTMLATPNPLTLMTAQASTSGTSIPFTGIPSWVKRITVMFNGVSTNGTSVLQIQLGTTSGFETSGYLSQASTFNNTPGGAFATTGLALTSAGAAGYNFNGIIPICLINTNSWTTSGVLMTASGTNATTLFAGSKTLSGTLTQVRVTTVNGTDTFDAGTINVMYE